MGVRSDLLRSQLSHGRPVRPATAGALIEAGTALAGRPPAEWDAGVFEALAWFGVLAWFRARGEQPPDDCGLALKALADHLDPGGRRGLAAAVVPLIGTRAEPVASRRSHTA